MGQGQEKGRLKDDAHVSGLGHRLNGGTVYCEEED